jgi:exonuclease III
MKLLTWNCNGALRKKFGPLQRFQADISIIQECENPGKSKYAKYREWASNSFWVGDNPHKGLGIFANPTIKLEKLDWKPRDLKYFIPCRVNDEFNLLGTWCYGGNLLKDYRYIGQLWKYLKLHKNKLGKSIIAGDFNSNVFWDKPRRNWNHSDVVHELNDLGLESLYHTFHKEVQGKETQPTFIFQKNVSKPYHIDYMFASRELMQNIKSVSVGRTENWLDKSDHMPIFCEI